MDKQHPYAGLPGRSFWRTAVADRNFLEITELWDPKFNIDKGHKIATFGSCFAQHIGRALRANGFTWLDTEPCPEGVPEAVAREYNYGIYTCRTGNIYTTSLLQQWVDWATERQTPPDEYWTSGGRFFDPFRPTIEPQGFGSIEELLASRRQTIHSLKLAIESANVMVFTLGLTEGWINSQHGYEYPICPGTTVGEFDASQHAFRNLQFQQVLSHLKTAIDAMRSLNPKLRLLLTVSPVPLTATRSGHHVLVATMESKSILRAVAGQLAANRGFVDYFPSYEIINSAPFRGAFFEANQRSVSQAGVGHVMRTFFEGLTAKFAARPSDSPLASTGAGAELEGASTDDPVCEEQLLSAFSPR